jgi:hypothetical protein
MKLYRVEIYAINRNMNEDWEFRHNVKDPCYYPSITEASEVLLEKNVDMKINILTIKMIEDADLKTGEFRAAHELNRDWKGVLSK